MTLQYYVYISDDKIDMLLPQIPHSIRESAATELRIDLKVLTATRKVEHRSPVTRVQRLTALVDYIERKEQDQLGTVHAPRAYVKGMMELRGGCSEQAGMVLFSGRAEATIVALIGSQKHILGAPPAVRDNLPSSGLSLGDIDEWAIDFMGGAGCHWLGQCERGADADCFRTGLAPVKRPHGPSQWHPARARQFAKLSALREKRVDPAGNA